VASPQAKQPPVRLPAGRTPSRGSASPTKPACAAVALCTGQLRSRTSRCTSRVLPATPGTRRQLRCELLCSSCGVRSPAGGRRAGGEATTGRPDVAHHGAGASWRVRRFSRWRLDGASCCGASWERTSRGRTTPLAGPCFFGHHPYPRRARSTSSTTPSPPIQVPLRPTARTLCRSLRMRYSLGGPQTGWTGGCVLLRVPCKNHSPTTTPKGVLCAVPLGD